MSAVGQGPPSDKVVLVGNPGVGKTTIFQRFKTGHFMPEDSLSHRDKPEHCKEWTTASGLKRSVTLYDTAGVERHTQTMLPTYFRHAKAVVLVYSIDNSETFDDVGENWLDNSVNAAGRVQLVLVGNKLDLVSGGGRSRRAISRERALQYAMNVDIEEDMVFEVSAKTGEGIAEMFDAIADAIAPAVPPAPEAKKEENKPLPCCS